MASLSQIPTSNLQIVDVRDTLAANGGSVSNDATTFFTTAANINPWSKHKPVPILSKNFVQDFDSSRSDYDADWWKGDDGKCGLSWSTYTSVDAVKGKNWTYTPPSGNYPKRLGDFAGYDADANPPIATRISASNINVDWDVDGSEEQKKFTITVDIPTSNYYELSIQDFNISLEGYRLFAQAGQYSYIGDSIFAENPSVSIDLDDIKEGITSVFVCLISANGGVYVPLPSDESNKVEFNLNVKHVVPYYIDALGVSESLSTTGDGFVPLEDYPWGQGMPPTDSVYFKAEVIKNTVSAESLTASNLWGISESWIPIYDEYDGSVIGHETITSSLSGKIYIIENGVRKGVESIPLGDMEVGERRTFYFYWGGYGYPVYEDPEWNIDAGLTIRLGSTEGAWVAGFGYYQTRYDVEH